jgi:fucose 4-O-acetylase-like acetyltransferase
MTAVEKVPESQSSPTAARLLFIDNLRWLMIVLVVTIHAAVTYSGVGSWYYKDTGKPGPWAMLFFVFYETHVQAFFMGLLFLIAGYFVPSSYDRKGPGRFLSDRAIRLGVPTLIYAMLIHPSMGYVLHGASGERSASLLRDYAHYVLSLDFLSGTGPLWFAMALLIFSAVYACGRVLGMKGKGSGNRVPSNVDILILIIVMALGSFLVRLVQPIGTAVLNMQLCFFTQYVLLFVIGCAARQRNWMENIPTRFGMRWWIVAAAAGVPFWFAIILLGGAARGQFDRYAGGLYWQSAVYCTWESLFCVGTCLGLLTWFRERFNRQGALARFLSANAFAVYVFHAPILVGLALAMRGWIGPPFEKFLALTAAGLVASFLVAHLLVRRIPGLKNVMS